MSETIIYKVWLTQYQIAKLFQSSRSNIMEYIKNNSKTAEPDEPSTCRKFRQVRWQSLQFNQINPHAL